MGEDRRPNVGGYPLDEQEPATREGPEREQIELRAKSLRKRDSVDGHEESPSLSAKEEGAG